MTRALNPVVPVCLGCIKNVFMVNIMIGRAGTECLWNQLQIRALVSKPSGAVYSRRKTCVLCDHEKKLQMSECGLLQMPLQ